MKRIAVVLTLVLGFTICTAQIDDPNESPYAVIYNHLFYLQTDSYNPILASRSFPESPDSSDARDLGIQLKQVLDGQGLFVRLNVIPDTEDYLDSLEQIHSYVIFPDELPEVYVEKVEGKWYYSRQTVEAIPSLHKKVYPFGSDLLVNIFPQSGGSKILGLYPWQYLGLLILLLLGLVFFMLVNWFTKKAIYSIKAISRSFLDNQAKILRGIHHMIAAWLLIQFFVFFLPVLQLPVKTSEVAHTGLRIISSLVLLFLFFRIFDLVVAYVSRITRETESKMDDQLIPLLKRVGQFIILTLWLLHLLSIMNVNITAMIAGISIGGLAIALAAQDTLKNLFGSITIFLDRPFQIGDWIVTGDAEGVVEEVGFRSTRIRSFANSLISVPNSRLSDTKVDNFGLRRFRRYSTRIGITYDTPPDTVQKFVDGLRELVRNNDDVVKESFEIHLNDLGASALEIMFYIFFQVPDWRTELSAKHHLLLDILRLAEELGVSFAFPSQSIYIEKQAE